MPGHVTEIPKPVVAAALACLFLAAFVLSPYWRIPVAIWEQIALLGLLLLLGAAWVLAASGRPRLLLAGREIVGLAGLGAVLFSINFPMLTSGIPWRGDEDLHIVRTLGFVQRMPFTLLGLLVLLAALAIALAARSGRLAAASLIVFGILAGFVGLRSEIFAGRPLDWLARYPVVNYWLFMLAPAVFQRFVGPYHEILYRVVPLLALTGTSWMFLHHIESQKWPVAMFLGVIVGTIPVVIYYSSILYIEPLAVLAMTLVCMRIRGLLVDDLAALRTRPEWYALVTLGFIKETTAAFLVCFAVCRLAVRIRLRVHAERAEPAVARRELRSSNRGKWLLKEMTVLLAALIPIGIFVGIRTALAHVRGLDLGVSGILDTGVYRATAQSLWDQFGVFIILFLAGLMVAMKRHDAARALFLSLVFFATPATLLFDSGGIYAGLSRFNLLILPPILAGAAIAIQAISKWKGALFLVAAATFIANLLLTPINLDGTKKPLWGAYLIDTSEHYYPYREALTWLKTQGTTGRILFADLDYPYLFDFYFRQLDWQPRHRVLPAAIPRGGNREFGLYFDCCHWQPQRALLRAWYDAPAWDEAAALRRALQFASSGGFRTVVFQVLGSELPDVPTEGGFRLSKIVENDAHSLLILSRVP